MTSGILGLRPLLVLLGATSLLLGEPQEPEAGRGERTRIDFVRDIEPLLHAHCVTCHGREKSKGRLRLDAKAPAMGGGGTGVAIIPGKSAESLLLQRLLESDADRRMPKNAAPLPPAKVDLVRRWIDEGASWPERAAGQANVRDHWAYLKPARPPRPPVKNEAWVRNAIDQFILCRLEKEGMTPQAEAPKDKLLRRVSLDLTGLPPTLDDMDAFANDQSPQAYERVVDRLLASPHYGERWARPWLDLARYADTNGFNYDSPRPMSKYRDWVIRALNSDMPFTQFTIEQIAGDLLPNATLEQRIATGFHRNTMTNEEGGVDPLEARWETLVDRVNTTAAVWLGTTLACAQCHSHKYDPFSQIDYYRFLAFFEHSDESRIELLTPLEEEERARVRQALATREKELQKWDVPTNVAKALEKPIERRSHANSQVLTYCREQAPADLHPLTSKILELNRELERLDGGTALVLEERPGTEVPSAHVRIKGAYSQIGERVSAGVPGALHPFPEDLPKNRLGLARWLVSPENPLVARVVVNRFWAEIFGRPLVESPEDFGTQGLPPTHPELLDWLATEFMRAGWSMKAIHRTIVLSSTYRQSSEVGPSLKERDPYNRLLGRGPRFRMEAEMIRDVVLSASGQLSRKIGGPSVFPLQADMSGVVAANKVDTGWTPSPGEDRYRRGLYTHWRRTAPYSAFAAFDAPSREWCTISRARTNTPLQALTALNDPAFFDAARGLALRIMAEAPPGVRARASFAFRLCTNRRPAEVELDLLTGAVKEELEQFDLDPSAARSMFRGSSARPRDADLAEAAAWTMIANVLLNLDETLTKE